MTSIRNSLLLLAKPAVGLSLGVLHQPNEMGCAIGHVRLNCTEHATNYQAVRSIPRREPALPRFRRWVVRVAAEPVPGRVQRAGEAAVVGRGARGGGGGGGAGRGGGGGAAGGAGGAGAAGAGAPGAGAGPGAAGAGAGAGGAGASGRTDSASAFAPLTSTGSLAVPSHTTNQR